MENSIIGTQITKFRKAAGLTQEELGKAVGVSTQAVSRWECGGTPDVALLPAIADRLGVTVDALFGREGGETVDVFQTVRNWVYGLPRDQLLDRLNRLLWAGISQIPFGAKQMESLPFLQSCHEITMADVQSDEITCSNLETDHGIYFGVSAEDLAFSILCPRPEEGYRAYFPEHEIARDFYALLAQPNCLELMEFIMSQEDRYYSREVLARGIGKEPAELESLLDRLCVTGLINYTEVGMLDGPAKVYSIGNVSALVPVFYLTRILTQKHSIFYLNYGGRRKPLL